VRYSDTAKEEHARWQIEMIRWEDRFDPDTVGEDEALRNTKKYFEENEFHFRDPKFGLKSFLAEKFPCGARPCDIINS
jgi:hypothetical protein